MSALEAIEKLLSTQLAQTHLRYCFVDEFKRPFRIDNNLARTNVAEDFVPIEDLLLCTDIDKYAGVGISIQASKICAIDVDSCFEVANDISSADSRASAVLEMFRDCAYCEFSFSGNGLRVLFEHDVINDYNTRYYIKNGRIHVEYYQPSNSNRYVTLTGNSIADVAVDANKQKAHKKLIEFLDTYMRRTQVQHQVNTVKSETRSFDELKKQVRIHLFRNSYFQSQWFTRAPGSGSNESERDFYLVSYLFENITQDKEMLRQLFEMSDFFQSKDCKHAHKWESNEHRYYNYLYDQMLRRH